MLSLRLVQLFLEQDLTKTSLFNSPEWTTKDKEREEEQYIFFVHKTPPPQKKHEIVMGHNHSQSEEM